MTKYVIDAYAWIEYLDGSDKGRVAAKIIEDETNEIFISAATVAEVVSKFLRLEKDSTIALNAINNLSSIIEVNSDIGTLAGKIHFESKKKNKDFGMLDSFVAATAKSINAKILTGDTDFKNFKEAVFILISS